METNYLGKGESRYWLGKVAVIVGWCRNSLLSPGISLQSDVGVHSSNPQWVLCFLHEREANSPACTYSASLVGFVSSTQWGLMRLICGFSGLAEAATHLLSTTQWARHIFFSIHPSQITTLTSQTRRQSTHREGEITSRLENLNHLLFLKSNLFQLRISKGVVCGGGIPVVSSHVGTHGVWTHHLPLWLVGLMFHYHRGPEMKE